MIPMYSYPGPGAMRRALRRILTPLVCGAFLLAGCSKDLADEPGRVPADPEPPAAESGTLNLSISVSGVSSARPGTYALTPEQEAIVNMAQFNVLLFRTEKKAATDDKFEFVRYAPAKERGDAAGGNNGAYQRHFTIELPQERPGEDPKFYKVMVVANYSAAGADDAAKSKYWEALLGGKTLSDARGVIRFAQEDGTIWNTAAGGGATPLPLWGETQTAFTTQVVRVATIHLLRAVARIDVGVNLGGKIMNEKNEFTGRYDLTSNAYKGNTMDIAGHSFEIEAVTLHNAAREGFLAPNPDNLDPTTKQFVTKPTIDNKLAKHDQNLTYKKEGDAAGNMLRSQIYLPESPNKTDDNREAFYIVVQGKYNGGTSTFYRVDFYNRAGKDGAGTEHEHYVKPSADNRYDILRNHAYVINILRVRGAGYPSEEAAAASEPMNMEVDVYTWDTGDGSMGNIVTDGQYRLALSSVQLRYHQDGTAQEVTVFTDFELKGNDLDKGWKLSMRKDDVTVNGKDCHQDVKVEIFRKGNWETLTAKPDGDNYFWTSGEPHQQYKLRVGLSRFDEKNDAGLMERTLRLLFTAGRMSQTLELVQDVKNTRTLSLLQQKLYFPKYPKDKQQVIVKSSPAGATYYVSWTDDQGTHRMNISDPGAAPVPGRDGDLGGFNQLTEVQKNQLPKGFAAYANHPLPDNATDNCAAITFFGKENENIFSLLPSNWDDAHNDGAEPKAPRSWRFEIEGYWDEAGNLDKNPERTKLDVEQSYFEVKWEVDSFDGGKPLQPVDPVNPENPNNLPNFIRVAWDAKSVTPRVVTLPAVLPWYFVSKTEAGNLTGEEWVTNWNDYPNATKQGSTNISFTLRPNPSLQKRTVTMQANSPVDGFDKTRSTLTIEQAEGPLRLEIVPSTNVTQGDNFTSVKHSGGDIPTGNATYTLDMSTAAARRLYALSVRANSAWWWEWRRSERGTAETDELGDRDAGLTDDAQSIQAFLAKSYDHTAAQPKAVNLHHDHRYWKNVNGQVPDKDKPGYVLSTQVPVQNPGIANATPENRDETSSERTWPQALPLYSAEGFYLAPNALNDDDLMGANYKRTIPLAGQYYSEMQFYNLHNLIDNGNETDEGQAKENDKIKAATKILRIQRTVPSMTFVKRPFNGQNDVNLSNFQDPELPAGEIAWKDQPIVIHSNNKVTIKFYNAIGMGANYQPVATLDLYPQAAKYSTVLETTLGELNTRVNDGKPEGQWFINPDKVGYETDGGYRRYRITIEGYRQKEKDGADEKFTTVLEYYSGYYIVHPATAQIAQHGKYSYRGFDLLLDFSGSAYHKDQRVRVGCKKYHIGTYNADNSFTSAKEYNDRGESNAVETTYTEYKLDGSQFQRYIRYTVPENKDPEHFYIYWVEYRPYNSTEWSRVWSKNDYSSQPTWNGFLFSQEAYSPNGLVFLKDGPTVPAIPGPATMNRGEAWNYVARWDNRKNFDEAGAEIFVKPEFTNTLATYYPQGMQDPFTKNMFGVASEAGHGSNQNTDGKPFAKQQTVDAYKALRPGYRTHAGVFTGWKLSVHGTHSCVGSRKHGRNEWKHLSFYTGTDGFTCGLGHGVTRKWLQIIETITPTYLTTAGETRGPIDLIVVRKAITGWPGDMPAYNTALEGTRQNP